MRGRQGVRDLAAEEVIVGTQRIGVQRQEAETPPALPGLSVLCSVQPQPMSDHWGVIYKKDVRVHVHHNFEINLLYVC